MVLRQHDYVTAALDWCNSYYYRLRPQDVNNIRTAVCEVNVAWKTFRTTMNRPLFDATYLTRFVDALKFYVYMQYTTEPADFSVGYYMLKIADEIDWRQQG